jgi:hypothetical protein
MEVECALFVARASIMERPAEARAIEPSPTRAWWTARAYAGVACAAAIVLAIVASVGVNDRAEVPGSPVTRAIEVESGRGEDTFASLASLASIARTDEIAFCAAAPLRPAIDGVLACGLGRESPVSRDVAPMCALP